MHTTPVVAYPFENFVLACSTADNPEHVLIWIKVRSTPEQIRHTYIILIDVLIKIPTVRLPRNNICEAGAEFWVLLVTGDLASFEAKARINPKGLVVEISMEGLATVVEICKIEVNINTYSDSLSTEAQFIGRLIFG